MSTLNLDVLVASLKTYFVTLPATVGQIVLNGWAIERATDTVVGVSERATQAEVNTGTDSERFVTPLTLATSIQSRGEKNLMYEPLDLALWPDQFTFTNKANDTYFGLWNLLHNATTPNMPDITRVSAAAGDTAAAWARLTVKQNSTQLGIVQFFENLDTNWLRNRQLSLSLEAKATNITEIRMAIVYWTSTSNAITSSMVSSWGTGNPTLATNWAYANTPSGSLTVGTSFAPLKVEGITLPDTANNFGVFIWLPNSESNGDLIEIRKVQLEPGPMSTLYHMPHLEIQLLRTARFCRKSYNIVTFPGATGHILGRIHPAQSVARIWYPEVFFPSMVNIPNVNIYSINGTVGRVNDMTGADLGADNDTVMANISVNGANSIFEPDNSFVAGTWYGWDYFADARL